MILLPLVLVDINPIGGRRCVTTILLRLLLAPLLRVHVRTNDRYYY